MRKPVKFEVRAYGDVYKGELTHKFNVLMGDSAQGKSRFHSAVGTLGSIKISQFSVVSLSQGLYEGDAFRESIVVAVEDDIEFIERDNLYDKMLKAVCRFIIVDRDELSWLPINYRAVYRWSNNSKYHELHEYYDKYSYTDIFSVHEPILCEDSKSCFLYLSSYFTNVYSADGNSNISKLCVNKFVVADGAAIAPFLRKILDARPSGLLLPPSFEYLVCYRLAPRDDRVKNPYSYVDDDTFNSLERYYFKLVKELFSDIGRVYTKSNCDLFLMSMKLLPICKELSKWGAHCKINGIDNQSKESRKLLQCSGLSNLSDSVCGITDKVTPLDIYMSNNKIDIDRKDEILLWMANKANTVVEDLDAIYAFIEKYFI